MTTVLINTEIKFPGTSPKYLISLALEKEGYCTIKVSSEHEGNDKIFSQENKYVYGTTESGVIKDALKVFNRMVTKYTNEFLNK